MSDENERKARELCGVHPAETVHPESFAGRITAALAEAERPIGDADVR